MDTFAEQLVTKTQNSSDSIKKIIVLAGGGVIVALLLYLTFIFPLTFILAAGAAYAIYLLFTGLNIEYEYTYTSGEMDYAKVMGGRRRKHLLTLRLKDAEAGGLADGDRFNRYQSMQGVKNIDMTLNFDAKKYFIYFIREGNKHLLTMECSDEMWDMILKTNPRLGA